MARVLKCGPCLRINRLMAVAPACVPYGIVQLSLRPGGCAGCHSLPAQEPGAGGRPRRRVDGDLTRNHLRGISYLWGVCCGRSTVASRICAASAVVIASGEWALKEIGICIDTLLTHQNTIHSIHIHRTRFVAGRPRCSSPERAAPSLSRWRFTRAGTSAAMEASSP